MKTYLPLVSLFFCGFLFAQTRNPALDINRANIWHFGSYGGVMTNNAPSIHFETGSPVVFTNGKAGSVSTICDSTGNLQMYGGAFKAVNKIHNLMSNSGFVGDSGFINILQSALAIPKPKSEDTIYYFTSSLALRYNVIDMKGDNGNGVFVKRNARLFPGSVGVKIAAVHHCNGVDIWIVAHEWGTNKFLAYLITENGLDTIPIISAVGPMDNTANSYQGGTIKFSPNGNKLAYTANGSVIHQYLFNFDKSTGIVSNAIRLQRDNSANGVSFSPDNSKLYFGTNDGELVQYDLTSGDSTAIANSRKYIYVNSWHSTAYAFSRMQIARDGKLYVQKKGFPGVDYVGVINEPNVLDTFCDFNPSGLYLNGSTGTSDGFMNTVESYFYTGTSAFPCYGDTNNVDCNDSNVCTIDNYHPATGCVYSSVSCDDYDSCTIDACDSITGCFYMPIVNCIDGLSSVAGKIYARIAPNPFHDYTVIEIKNPLLNNEKAEFCLYDALGRECKSNIKELKFGINEVKAVLNRGQLKAGIYFLMVQTSFQTFTIKLSIL